MDTIWSSLCYIRTLYTDFVICIRLLKIRICFILSFYEAKSGKLCIYKNVQNSINIRKKFISFMAIAFVV